MVREREKKYLFTTDLFLCKIHLCFSPPDWTFEFIQIFYKNAKINRKLNERIHSGCKKVTIFLLLQKKKYFLDVHNTKFFQKVTLRVWVKN